MNTTPMNSANAAASSRGPGKLVIHSPYEEGRVFSLETGRISLGRAASNDLAYPDDTGLSRQHLVISREGADLIVTDLGSKNGTDERSGAGERTGGLSSGEAAIGADALYGTERRSRRYGDGAGDGVECGLRSASPYLPNFRQ